MQQPETKQSVIIVAGGKGLRVGGEIPKQFCEIGGKPMLMRTIEAFYRFNNAMQIVLVLPETHLDLWLELCEKQSFSIPTTIAFGGETRFHSVKNGLEKVSSECIVGVHDAARPFISQSVISECYRLAAELQCGVIPVIDEKNSVRQITDSGNEPMDRNRIKIVQTPQVFPAHLLKKAYQLNFDSSFTDDASVAEKANIAIHLAVGSELNLKITTPFEMQLAEFYLQKTGK